MKKFLDKIKDCADFNYSIEKCEKQITPILQGFITNFPDYTDHSINHSKSVIVYAELVMGEELNKLNQDEIYIFIMAGFLHDIGMCPTPKMKSRILESHKFIESNKSFENYLREIHHELSFEYITTHWEKLGIINETYAHAIGMVGMGHRVVNLLNFEEYKPEFIVKSGTDYVCLPYLATIIRIADELDITNDRTPDLLYSEYLPENIISKKEWDKHKANYFVNFRHQTIKITAKCSDKDIYYALLKHYKKIEDVIKYVQKVITMLPSNERNLKIDFVKLEKDIQTIGFIPKNIGFSFDLQNTINTFIGANIYDNKFVAIRECLQNSIDSCRFKLHLNKSDYIPELCVKLKDNMLIISDNGIGMDDFIVENYFAKLSKSYYAESKISDEFEAISQFGVGVFSYFLLCDYFDVETTQDSKETLKFRVTKNAENYFYFFDSTNKSNVGTTITIHLSEELEIDELVKQIRHYIRFLDFPIKVVFNENEEIVNSQIFEVDKVILLEKNIEREYKKVLKDLITVDAEFSDEYCEGALGLLMSKEDNTFIPIKGYDALGTYRTSVIEVSQKGIYVGSFQSLQIKSILGKINLKHKNEIDLGRYKIKNGNVLDEIYMNFYKIILKKVFDNWKNKEAETRYKLCRDFIGYYFESYLIYDEEILSLMHSNLFVKVYDGKVINHIPIEETFKFENIVVLRKESPFDPIATYNDIDYSTVYKQVNCPIIIENWSPTASFILNIFKARKNLIRISCTEKHWFFKISLQKVATSNDFDEISSNSYRASETYLFDNAQHICASTNISTETPLNLNNNIVNFYLRNRSKNKNNKELLLVYRDFFYELGSFFFNFHNYYNKTQPKAVDEINYFNSLLNKINKYEGTSFKLSQQDFPNWMNEKIKWEEIE
ncbi:HD domain-containing protein [Flavobacterium sp. GA093]|uniref:HD domain-containing protein n=1 Tax=Flavobacterium hydrocarbonoxydans TaxID=2683249 RepID=A0A6I4NIM5_9FLAO|nr:ATP-binding protein [Flavobacterium hydrocarbonoxydans]MWB94011.1 HD domain-containing protein [Flavobacterium hydrocarbonoxydans]